VTWNNILNASFPDGVLSYPYDATQGRSAYLTKVYSPRIREKLSEKPHERAKRLTIRRLIATYMNASALSGTLS
jgi:hypothetical protein